MTFKEDSDICENIVSLHHGILYERISFPHWRVDGILCHHCHLHTFLAQGEDALPDGVGMDYGDMGIDEPEGHHTDLPRDVHTGDT